MNEILRYRLFQQYRDYAAGQPMQRLVLASGVSDAGLIWSLDVVEYLAAGVEREDFINAALQCESRRIPLPGSLVLRQVELRVGLSLQVMEIPMRIDAHHLNQERSIVF